jgi:hypothetical protein
MRWLSITHRQARLVVAAILASLLAAVPAIAFGREEVKVSMEDILKEINIMRREIRELKIQRDRDQRTIEDLRRIVEQGIPAVATEGPLPAVARPPDAAAAGKAAAAVAPTTPSR